MRELSLQLSIARCRRWLLAAVACLTVASAAAQVSRHALDQEYLEGIVYYVDSAREGNLPTWFSSLLLLAAGVVVGGIAVRVRARDGGGAWRPAAVLAVVILFAALDEATSVHEKVGNAFERRVGDLQGPLRYGWVVPALIGLLVLAVYLGRHAPRLPAAVRPEALAAVALFLGGAVGLEMVEGVIATEYGRDSPGEDAVIVVEEAMEMLGGLLALTAALRYYALTALRVRIDVRSG